MAKHIWTTDMRWTWQFCKVCGIVRRADEKNKPCKGPTKLRPMEGINRG